MKINRNDIDVRTSPKNACKSCAFLYRQTPACLLLISHLHLPCGGEFTYTASEIFKL